MKWQRLYRAELMVSLRDLSSVIIIIIAILAALIVGYYQSTESQRNLTVALVNSDKGELGQELIKALENEENITIEIVDLDEAKRLLKRDKVETIGIIGENFSYEINNGNYENLVTVINSSSSQYHATVIEPLINNITIMWMQKVLLEETKAFYQDNGKIMSQETAEAYLKEAEYIRNHGTTITINKIVVEDTKSAAKLTGFMDLATAWYAVFALFYLIISGTWMLELSKKGLKVRTVREGMSQAKMYFAVSLSKLTLVIGGYLIVLALTAASAESPLDVLINVLGMIIYLVGILGFSLALTVFANGLTALMLLAPLLTFLTGVLSGLVLNLPNWAYMFEVISKILPGRWYHSALIGSPDYLAGIICSVAWCFLGYLLSKNKTSRYKY